MSSRRPQGVSSHRGIHGKHPLMGRVQMTQAERTRNIKYVLLKSSRWLLHRRRDTKKINIPGCRKKMRRKRKAKNEKQEARHKTKQENRTQGVSIATNLPVSAAKPRRGPCHTICQFLPALVGNGIKCHCCRCRASPPREQINENQTKYTLVCPTRNAQCLHMLFQL